MSPLDRRVGRIRQFNRFYTREIGVLHERLLHRPFSLAEVRILYEIARLSNPTAQHLCRDLALDPGYVSRIVAGLRRRDMVTRDRSASDRRQFALSLTARGRTAFAALDRRAHGEMRTRLGRLSVEHQQQLVQALDRVEALLGGETQSSAPCILRHHRPGDMGWVIYRHGAIYAEEYGWDESFEALVAEIAARFLRNYDPRRERCWIAERNGVPAGSVFLVRKTDRVAQLRLLLVEPSARGLGLGKLLVNECVHFARQAGYRKMVLWTNSILHAARRIYEETGFRMVAQEKHPLFGKNLVSQTWELQLR